VDRGGNDDGAAEDDGSDHDRERDVLIVFDFLAH